MKHRRISGGHASCRFSEVFVLGDWPPMFEICTSTREAAGSWRGRWRLAGDWTLAAIHAGSARAKIGHHSQP